ncbi:hypothetical protein DWX08_10540 [Ruminococcus sp. AF18-22]|nr:hypothetical protein DWX08_10540 [Ruminococcus sp. AF18-22]
MLTKEAKQILNYVIPLFESGKDTVPIAEISKETGLSPLEAKSTTDYLVSIGYFKIKRYLEGSFIYSPSHEALHYKEFEKASNKISLQTNIFNAPVSGSAIGNTGTVTITNGLSYNEVLQAINSRTDISESDKTEAKKVVEYIENITSVDAPLPKSFLSRFSDTLSKHSWLPSLIGNLLIRYFLG